MNCGVNMKHLFFMSDLVAGGGAEMVLHDVVKHLHDRYKITVMTYDNNRSLAKETFPDNVKYIPARIHNPYSRRNPLRYAISLCNRIRTFWIRKIAYDVAIANKEGPCMLYVSKMNAKKKLAWIHTDYTYLHWTRNFFEEGNEFACMQLFDRIVCVSNAAMNSVRNVIGDPGNLCVRYNPMDVEKIRQNAAENIPLATDMTRPVLVAVGRLAKEKNLTTLTRVCARLSKEFAFELWLIGDGPEREDIEQILQSENCTCIKLFGMQNNPHKFMRHADLFVSSSLCESYGLAIQESLILGVPILTTTCPAIEECVSNDFGIMVDCDETSIENGLRYILEHPECLPLYKQKIRASYAAENLWLPRLQKIEELLT